MKKIILTLTLLIYLLPSGLFAQTPIWQGKGRIAISSDGNEHDDDDWSATPMSLAILAASGLQDKLAIYTYSDHIWGSNVCHPNKNGISAYEQMRVSALQGKAQFGFNKTKFVCAVDNAERAYQAMVEVINESTEDNPLIIIAGGPMQVVGESMNRANKEALKYVTLISHSWWNNEHSDWWSDDVDRPFPAAKSKEWDAHSGWTFDEIVEKFTKKEYGAKCIYILDQNGGKDKDGNVYEGLASGIERFEWIKTSPARNNPAYKKGSWDWLYSRLMCVVRNKPTGKGFDVSDAGMVVYMLTGIETTNVDMVKKIMENPVTK